jgi:predicted aspartyl protease
MTYPKYWRVATLLLALLPIFLLSKVNAATNILTEWVPFKIQNSHIVVKIKVKGSAVEAVVDTGANLSAIHYDLAKEVGVRASREKVEVSGIGKTKKLALSRKATISIDGLFAKRLPLLIFKTKMNARFILGMDYLAHGVLQIDYINLRLRLATPGSFRFPAQNAIPLTRKGLLYYLDVSIDNTNVQMMLDTGNADIVSIPYAAVSETPLYLAIKDKAELNIAGGGIHAANVKVLQGLSNNFKIGQYTLENVEYQIAAKSNAYAGHAIIGYDILKHFLVTIDLINNNLYLSGR